MKNVHSNFTRFNMEKKKQFQQTTGVLKMHKHLEPADLQIHEHEIPLHKA